MKRRLALAAALALLLPLALKPLDAAQKTTALLSTISTTLSGALQTWTTTAANGWLSVGGANGTLLIGQLGSTPFLQTSTGVTVPFSVQTSASAPLGILSAAAT